jgi:uncharacterized membrane protein
VALLSAALPKAIRDGVRINYMAYKLTNRLMKKNMGSTDRIIRSLLAITAIILYTTGIVTGTLVIGLMVLSGIFLLTSLVSFCPLYTLIGLNTCPARR